MHEKVSCQQLSGAPVNIMTDAMFVYPQWLMSFLLISYSHPHRFFLFQYIIPFPSRSHPCSINHLVLPLAYPPCLCSWTTGASQWHSWSGCCVASLQGWSTSQTWTTSTETSPHGISWWTATWSARFPTLGCRAFWMTILLTRLTRARWLVLPPSVFTHSVCLIELVDLIPFTCFMFKEACVTFHVCQYFLQRVSRLWNLH